MHEADTGTSTDGNGAAHVVVIGGGIAGLAAAHRLVGTGARVTLLEASDRLGGKLHAGELAGVPVDLGAESLLARRPEAVGLAREVGLGDALQPPATASAALWTRGALRPLPRGSVMGVTADTEVLREAGILSAEGLRRVAQDAELPPTEVGEDIAVGAYVAARVGHELVDRLVEPLLGGVYAGDAYRISLRAAVPALYAAARTHGTLGAAVRAAQGDAAAAARTSVIGAAATGPVFQGIAGGIGRLPLAVADAVRAAGARVLTGTAATGLARTAAGGWRVTAAAPAGAEVLDADAVVLATPAGPAARLLADQAPAAAAELREVEYASMALVTMVLRRADLPADLAGSGFLVPHADGRTIKASTFSGNKWGWSGQADPELFALRTSVGRYGDEGDLKREDGELVEASLADLRAAVGLAARPVAATVTRWDGGLPQYPVGHLARVARIRAAVAALPGLAVCGAPYDGVGIPACIASAEAAARTVTERLADRPAAPRQP
ncbi:protoporphyrinogen oxidase [Streptomyces sp. NPDC093225]|uniref:protoporphyrinogen oxidase n=1 Tax=Streptomyces sp. NPDC093225 TaxID=3366034 RepID=UPI0038173E3B